MNEQKPEIVLGMPGYGRQSAAAGRALWCASCDMTRVDVRYQAGSLLASNFNQLWCHTLNRVERGELVDYFAMLHDDVGPEAFWLDRMIDIMCEQDIDVLGVVVPIKDSRGMTSLALHCTDDDWMPLARLSMHDVYELPETFTSEDLGAKLLLNTGCWVARWNQEWCRTVHFHIHDRIVFNTAVGRYQAQTIPEDWDFSRQLHEIGTGPTAHVRPLRIAATRAIACQHTGDQVFLNTYPWGQMPFDAETCQISPVPGAFPREIPGWLQPEEGRELARLATGKRVLEIGSYCGLSTVCMARTAQHVTAVDYFDGRGTPQPMDTMPFFQHNIERYGVSDKVTTCHPDADYPLPEYDMAFIDGAHDYESVAADIERARSVLAPDGLIVLHDYDHPSHPGVRQAAEDLIAQGGRIMSVTETIAVVRPPAQVPSEV